MKPSITPEIAAAKMTLAFQCEGMEASALWNAVKNQNVVAYAMPAGHSFLAAWVFRLVLDGGAYLEFSSTSTVVVDWQEVGSLNIRYVEHLNDRRPSEGLELAPVAVPPFRLSALEKLVYEDDDVVAECALVLAGETGGEIVIAAAIPPGAVSVAAPFTDGHFEPQFAISMCKREDL